MHKNRLQTSITNTPGDAGDLTIGSAASGCRTFAAGDDGLLFDVLIIDGSAWEVRTDCKYTHTGTSLARGTLEDSSTGSAIALTSSASVMNVATAGRGNDIAEVMNSALLGLTMSFKVPTSYRAWQGVCWWRNRFIATSDRDENFAISNTISVYSVTGKLVAELTNAYAGTDPGGKKMSFGSPFVQGDFLYVTAYNMNDGGSPQISRVLRYTLNPATGAVALDTSFGTSGVQSVGSNTVEQVAWINGEWWVCYFDQQYIRRFNTSWVSQGTVALSQTFPANGGSQAMIWEDSDATVYIIMHGPNSFASERSTEIHKYTRSDNALTYVATLQSPGFGLTQGASSGPLGYCWADRPGDRIWVTPDLIETPMRAHCPQSGWPNIFKPTLANNWVNYDTVYDRTAKAYFDQQTGRVYLEGIIKSGTTTNGTKLFNLPSYMRPKYSRSFPVVSNELFGAIGVVGTSASSGTPGDVIIRTGSATWLNLDGASWLAGN